MSTTISILGNTGNDVVLRYTDQATAIASFSIASNSFKNTPEGRVKKTDWYDVTAFGKLAEALAAKVRKGTFLFVQGRLSLKPWLTKSGEPRVGAEVILLSFEFAGSKREEDVVSEDDNLDDMGQETTSGVETPPAESVVNDTVAESMSEESESLINSF